MRISDWSSDVCSSDLAGPRTGDQRAAWGGGGRGDPRTRSRGRPSQPPRPSADDDAAARPGRAGREDPRTGPEDERGGRALAWPVGRDAECGTGTGERPGAGGPSQPPRTEEHTSELQSLMRNSYAVFCLKKKKKNNDNT